MEIPFKLPLKVIHDPQIRVCEIFDARSNSIMCEVDFFPEELPKIEALVQLANAARGMVPTTEVETTSEGSAIKES